jgi:gamma-glutamyltranspeptidase/glutathione hydrolase
MKPTLYTRVLRHCAPVLLALLIVIPALASGFKPEHAKHAMITSVHEQATLAGVEILKQGGNAVDAANAVGFALAVVHPAAGNLGGGGFLLLRTAHGELHFLDYREKASAAATANMYLDEHGNPREDASRLGYKSIGVPGSVAGMVYAQKKWGKLPLAKVMAPAIKLARDGVALTYDEADMMLDHDLGSFPESSRIFHRSGKYYRQGELFKQPELARTLERIAQNPDDFYHGAMARELAAAIQKGHGLVTAQDLAAYKVVERTPLRGTYRDLEIISAPPPSSGGVALIEALNILEGYDVRALGRNSATHVHFVAEAYRRAFFDRAEFLGDPDFAQIPVAQLLDKKYAAAWRDSIDPNKASVSTTLKRPSFGELDREAALHTPYIGPEPEHTTHYSVVDAEGNAVAVTTTLNDSFGSRVTAEGLGFLLNDEMDDFSAKPGTPNMFGLIQGQANAIAPGKRPLSSMTPTIVLRDGKLFLVLGSPGGATIITTVANVLINVADFGTDIQRAVNAPRFHQQWMPDELRVEAWQFSPDTLALLEQMGYKLNRTGSWGDAECIMIDPRNNDRWGASDARNSGKALGY